MERFKSLRSIVMFALAAGTLLGGCYGRAYYGGGYYYRARPAVYVQPRTVYVAPRPVYVQPAPTVYVAPRPVYVAPPPPPTVYVAPPRPVIRGTVYVR